MNKKLIALLLLTFSFLSVTTFAETIVLKSGKSIEGKIIEETDTYIKVNISGTPFALTYYLEEIKNIDGKEIIRTSKPQSISAINSSKKSATLEILNSEYTKKPDINDNMEIVDESSVEDILKKVRYHYAHHEFDKAIELCNVALKKTNDRELIARINFSLSSNYLEKGIAAYEKNKDDSFYKLSIEFSKKT